MKALGGIFLVLIVGAVLVHGYFQATFGTVSPCEAAIERIKHDKQKGGLVDKALGGLIQIGQDVMGDKRMAAELEQQKGMMGCYQIALMGSAE